MELEYKQQIKELLENKHRRLVKQITELKELVVPEGLDSAVGRVSRMDAINNRSVNEAALRKKAVQLKSIEAALKDIDKLEFGKCKKCGKSIPKERILLMPESKVCVDCAR
ncbi:MAG: TraR/DksA C4-type zinc finger protein [Prolixibacteraceae bacterium]|jgi:DnaK suppressor protein|nr:TraR/DksA C4-type zinc finger protein [Prolixibacteraceae bacterium]